MFWRDLELSWWWFRAPIETQAMMIEAFDEVMNDAKAVEDCKVWLLKQKQTQDWKTTKATADAVYALLLRGDNLLTSDALVEVTLGDADDQAGEGRGRHRLLRAAVPRGRDQARRWATITVKKTDEGVSWGSVHWQYLEDIAQGDAARRHAAEAGEDALQADATRRRARCSSRSRTAPLGGGRRAGGADRAAHRPRHGVRPPEGPPRQRHRAGERAVAVQVPGRPGATTRARSDTASHFFIDYLPKGDVRLRVRGAGAAQGQVPDRLSRTSSACTPRSSTATRRTSTWK